MEDMHDPADPATDPDRARRRGLLAERLQRRNLAASVLVPGPSLRYFTGLAAEASERLLIFVQPTDGAPLAIVPHFETGRVRQALADLPDLRVYSWRDESGPEPALARALAPYGTRPTAFGAEFGAMRLFERAAVETAVPRARWHPVDGEIGTLRQIKDAHEVAALRRAASIARLAAESGVRAAVAGASEREVAAACQGVLAQQGTASPFGVMVASGPRSADPHSGTSDRRLEDGDLCWIDLGAECEGYVGDVTRTVVVGSSTDSELQAAYDAVVRAQRAALAAVRPGITAAEVDAAARSSLAEAGLGAYFTHRTGHGLGLQPHEAPFIVDGNEEPLQPGMVFTVEPGVYVPGRGGVRVEDDVLVTDTGAEVLTA